MHDESRVIYIHLPKPNPCYTSLEQAAESFGLYTNAKKTKKNKADVF